MAMAAPAAARAAGSGAARATAGSSTTPRVSRSTRSIATHAARTRISTTEHAERARISTAEHERRQRSRVRAAEDISFNNAQIRQAEREEQRAYIVRRRRKNALTKAATAPLTSDAKPINVAQPIMLILFTWAGIVIMYALITQPSGTSGFLDSLREWVGMLYQTKPMFKLSYTEEG